MRRGAVPIIIAVVGVALGGCDSSTTGTPFPTSTTRVTQAPASTASPLAPKDANIVAAVAAIPAGSCHARHVNITDAQAWEPDPACTPGATDGGLPMAQLRPVAHTKQIRPPRHTPTRSSGRKCRPTATPAHPLPSKKTTSSRWSSVEHHATRTTSGRSHTRRRMRKTPSKAPRTTPSAPKRSRCRMHSIGSPPTGTCGVPEVGLRL